ncbi:MAG: RIO1 family regulatory kinase/ATPase domain-containing protein [Candidatus Hodarchaeales archaeon]|jgi:serine/threonine-protein kinase RIO1
MSTDHNQRIGFERYGKIAPGREDHREQRQTKVSPTEIRIADAITQLLESQKVKQIYSVIGGGKEATVLLAEDAKGDLVCAKVFRYYTSTIKKRLRGTIHLLPSDMAMIAAKQEYWNLHAMVKFTPVPKPRDILKNIVLMDFIPQDPANPLIPAPLIRDVNLLSFDPEEILHTAIDIIAQIFLECRMIHGDFSEHNIMIQTHSGELFTMDVSQSVEYNIKSFVSTPVRIRIDRAVKMLETDIRNINQFFKRIYKIGIDLEEVKNEIVSELPSNLKEYLSEKTQNIYPSDLISSESLSGKGEYRDNLVEKRTRKVRQSPKG